MVTAISELTNYQTQFANANLPCANSINEEFRKQAMAKFVQLGWPKKTNEQWRYTSLYALAEQTYNIDKPSYHPHTLELNRWYIDVYNNLEHKLPAGVTLLSLADAINDTQISSKLAKVEQDSLLALNSALMSDGFCLLVEEGCEVLEPIQIIYAINGNKTMHNTRVLLMLQANAKLNVVEHYLGQGEYCHNVVVQVDLAKQAKLDWQRVQQESAQAYNLTNILIQQAEKTELELLSCSLGSLLERTFIHVLLANQAQTKLQGLSILQDQQHVDYNSLVEHVGHNSVSHEHFKGLYAAQSCGVFKGDIRVKPGVKGVTSHQLNNNILLSANATVHTQPRLEIYNDDVQCSHGATIGQLDPQAIYYLRSRGMSYEQAKHIMLTSFVNTILSHCPSHTKAYLISAFDERLSDL